MCTLTGILANLIKEDHKADLDNKRESRLIVPGLTEDIADALHEDLKADKDITSYLVDGEKPDKTEKHISPGGLVSIRYGSYILVTYPGQLAQLPESMRGAGGPIRSEAFSEDWPWNDDGAEAFSFTGKVLDVLVGKWGGSDDDQQWLREFVLEGLIPETEPSPGRAKLLLEDILGKFSRDDYKEIPDIREKMLCHVGMPRPGGAELKPAKKVVNDTKALCKKILEKHRTEDDVRNFAKENIRRVFSEEEVQGAINAVDVLLDGIGQGEIMAEGPLAFWDCWEKNKTRDHWMCLTAPRLERIFDVALHENPELSVTMGNDQAVISSDLKNMVTFHGNEIQFSCDYFIPEDRQHLNWKIRLAYRTSTLLEEDIDPAADEHVFKLNSSDEKIGAYKSGLALMASLISNGRSRAEDRLKVHLCGAERPALVIVKTEPEAIPDNAGEVNEEPARKLFTVVNANAANNDDVPDDNDAPDETIVTDVPVYLYLLSSCGEPTVIDENEKTEELEREHPDIWRSRVSIDPSTNPGGQEKRRCAFGKRRTTIWLEAKDVQKGEFTLEDQLRVQIMGNSKLEGILGIFEGKNREPCRQLGKINTASRRLISLARTMTEKEGYRPLLADLRGTYYETTRQIGNYINCCGNIEQPEFEDVTFSELPKAENLLQEYVLIRSKIIKEIRKTLKDSNKFLEHPIYATHPIYVDTHAEVMEKLLVCYLTAYYKILDYLKEEHKETLNRRQKFVLLYLDCVVNYPQAQAPIDRDTEDIILVGPWHPLVLAKRYMVQAALVARAKRTREEDGKKFSGLAVLLKGITAFRWMSGIGKVSNNLEPFHVSPTSDPGWHMAIYSGLVDSGIDRNGLLEWMKCVKERLGLETTFLGGKKPDVSRAIGSFTRAFPSRRSLGLMVKKEYSTDEVISSVDRLLHNNEKATKTGEKLPGGIRLFFQGSIYDVDDVKWSGPPILVHSYKEGEEVEKEIIGSMFPDIYLMASAHNFDIEGMGSDEIRHSLPRGVDLEAVFSEPLSYLVEGQNAKIKSHTSEHDTFSGEPQEPSNLGEAYVRATAKTLLVSTSSLSEIVHKLELPSPLSSPWAIAPGEGLDPAMFVKYARDGVRNKQNVALWDYKVDIGEQRNTYYVLSQIPDIYHVAVEGFFDKVKVAEKFIEELGTLGIAIGGESLKSGRHALGVVGLVGSIRLFEGAFRTFQEDNNRVGFLIPVDPFASFFGRSTENNEYAMRTDLLAIQLLLPATNGDRLQIQVCGVESKFVSGEFNYADDALQQAKTSAELFKKLIDASLDKGGMPERLGLLAMLKFGLRIKSPLDDDTSRINAWIKKEKQVYEAVLHGNYECRDTTTNAVVVSTEGGLDGAARSTKRNHGLWIRITKEHWPGIKEDSPSLEGARLKISEIFGDSAPAGVNDSSSEDNIPGTVETGEKDDGGKQPDQSPIREILLGTDEHRKPVYFDPKRNGANLQNLNLMVTGSSGSGKTTFIKYVVTELRKQGKNVFLIDFKNDFADDDSFVQQASLNTISVKFDGLPFSPLIPAPVLNNRDRNWYIMPRDHITGIANVLCQTSSNMGPLQEELVQESIEEAFYSTNAPTSGKQGVNERIDYPEMSYVGEILKGKKGQSARGAYNRLKNILHSDLFPSGHEKNPFGKLMEQSPIVDLSQLGSEDDKLVIARLIVLLFNSHMKASGHSSTTRQILVFDEAHRVLTADYCEWFARECRSFGFGLFLSSQYSDDFPDTIKGAMETKIAYPEGSGSKQIKAVEELVNMDDLAQQAAFEEYEAIVDNKHHRKTRTLTMNYPLHLVYSYLLEKKRVAEDQMENIDGIIAGEGSTVREKIYEIVTLLEKRGLAERVDGFIKLVDRDDIDIPS